MLSAVAKAYLLLSVVVGAFALVYLDPLSLGSHDGGDQFGGTLLMMTAIGGLAFLFVTSFRSITDHEVEPIVPADAPPPSLHVAAPGPSAGASIFPLLVAVGLVLVGVGSAMGAAAFYPAIALLVAGAAGWLGQAFVEHPLATARLGDRVSRRTTNPVTYPGLAVLLGAVVAISISRIYLTLTEDGAIVVSGLAATLLFLGCLALASDRNLGRRLTGALAGIALVSVAGAGAASAARGERVVEPHPHPPITHQELHAEGIAYDKADITLTEGKVRFTFENADPAATYHNVGIYSSKVGGKPYVAILPIHGGKKATTLIDTHVVGLAAGQMYWFRCDFHPAMTGRVEVVSAPVATEEKVEKP